MGKTLLDLANRINKLKQELPEQVNELAKKTALVVLYDLTDVTPVDVSTAISNWQLRVGEKPNKAILAYYPGTKGSTEQESEQYADINALQNVKNKKPGQPIYIVNNVTYVMELNTGTSRQEPAGFIERAADLGRVFVRQNGLSKEKINVNAVDKDYPEKIF